ncbi:ABC transporter permease [Enterococcus ratti]|uniref:Efflux ABC transporter permease n=1 Tax=Enterococcus ratti TaxID=150033 RepID=A0A1L8WL29_9ENTE|nr:ABC transporter permease [Enterococcus ratti]OJG81728.1 efflux ABC transporter permease [Enterococcus ratti]
MKTKTYLKASFREIKQSKGRFVAIVLIIMLGTFLFVGVKTAGPVMQKTMDQYVEKENLSDLQIISSAGLTNQDYAEAKKIPNAQVETSKQFYYLNSTKNEVIQVFSYAAVNKQNRLEVVEGHLPKKNQELVLDEKAQKSGYKIGDIYTIDSDQVKNKSYKIVGFVRSPLFVNNLERGYANIGNGSIDYFVYLPEEEFNTTIYSVIYLTFKNVIFLNTYSKEYQDKMEQNRVTTETVFRNRAKARLNELKKQAMKSLQPVKQQVLISQKQINDARNQLKLAKSQLVQQRAMMEQLPEFQRETAINELSSQQTQLTAQEEKVMKQREKLIETQKQIKANEEKIKRLEKPIYRFQERSDNVGFQEFGDLAERIAAIANVFPVFFFFIAALITFTTMTRMIEENRREIGTLKALGYTKFEIAKKYAIYASLASGLGIILGSVLGTNLLPRIIFELSNERYDIGSAVIFYDWHPVLQAAIAFFIAAFGAAMLVLFKDLRERPATLLQPKAPKPGKRILLEYLTPLWSRLSFNQKISYRNLFRYKSRMFMAIIGIAGCTGLMVAGVGLKNSLSAVSEKQFGPITNYQVIVTLDKEIDQNETKTKRVLTEDPQVTGLLAVDMQTIELRKEGQAAQSLTMIVPKDVTQLSPFIYLTSQNGQSAHLSDSGIAITQKAAELFDLSQGETISLYTGKQKEWHVTVKNILQNYLGNFIYLTPTYYKKISGEKVITNAYLVQTKSMTKKQENSLAEKLLKKGAVLNTSFVSKQIEAQEESLANLDSVVMIFVVLSGLLAFIVLYNLTNINISERIRELSTIKVLGFFDKEVTMYIVRENIIFTLIGIIGGFGIGYVLTDFILQQASMETVIFPLIITWKAYILSAVLTIVFTVIVMIVTHSKLKHIHMIDALKSNE